MSVLSSFLCVILLMVSSVFAFPEKGKWAFHIDENTPIIGVSKSLFSQSTISFRVQCSDPTSNVSISWTLRHSPCWQEYISLDNTDSSGSLNILSSYILSPETIPDGLNYTAVEYVKSPEYIATCDGNNIILPEVVKTMNRRVILSISTEHPQYTISKEGVYLFVVKILPKSNAGNPKFAAKVFIEMKSDVGYLSVVDWPLLPFYGIMCGIYTVMGVLWLFICLYRWRDILRIQIWIGAVLFLGMLEKAVYLAEYESLNKTGELTLAAEYAAELFSCAKRSLARILVLIASMGFGIVKPRLGAVLQRIVGIGVIYMVLSSIESWMKLVQPKNDNSNNIYAASLLLALMDAGISFWIFSSLVQTTRTLRLRRNAVKLALYQHFTNTLIFAVATSLIFMLWSIYFHQMATCLTDWKELWLDDAFWKLLFSLLLVVIMILWRPTNNNQRYAFTPLLDSGDESEEDDVVVTDHLEGMKMRASRSTSNGGALSPHLKDESTDSIEDDLKWVEENIPTSLVESGIPLLDSEEEILTTRFELSKMQ